MKKVMLSLALMIGLAIQLDAQRVSLGIKADANMSNFILKNLEPMESNFGFGGDLGGFVKIDLGKYFALQPELLFHMQNSKTKVGTAENSFQYWGIEIPLYAVGQFYLKNNDRVYIGIGPYGRIGLNAKDKTNDINYYKENNGTEAFMQRGDIGLGAILGYEFDFGLQINATYKFGLLNALNNPVNDSFMRNQFISLGTGYRF